MRRIAALAAAVLAAAAVRAAGAVQTVTIGDLYAGGTVNLAPSDTLEVRLSAGPGRLRVGRGVQRPGRS